MNPLGREYRLDGALVDGITGLYAELNRLLMADEDWQVGASLDALNDVLHRVDGEVGETAPVRFVWAGRGRTYFELVLEVFADHPRIELVLS